MKLLFKLFQPKYLALESEDTFHDGDGVSSNGCCRVCSRRPTVKRARSCVLCARFSMITILVLLIILGVYIALNPFHLDSWLKSPCEGGFSTELSTAKSEISFRQVAFTGNINFFENGTSYLERVPGSKVFAGKPTDEIDENWRQLLLNRYFYFTEAEVIDSWGTSGLEEYYYVLSPDNERRYVAGLDALHTLHCVEQLRQTLDRDHYPKAQKPGSLHLYHCIDHIRQWIMCSSDFTPIPTRWHPGKDEAYVDTDQVHTCRNFDALWSWVQKREAVYRN